MANFSLKLADPRGPDAVLAEIKYDPALTAKEGIFMQCSAKGVRNRDYPFDC